MTCLLQEDARRRIVDSVVALLPLEEGFLVEYGNTPGHDVDLFGVVKEPREVAWILGGLDLLVLGGAECRRLVALCDPMVREPLLTGRFIAGSRGAYKEYRDLLASVRPGGDAVSHLLRRAVKDGEVARAWLRQHAASGDRAAAAFALLNLSFACTSMLTAQSILRDNSEDLSFKRFLAESSLLVKVRQRLREVRSGEDVGEIASLIDAWERALISGQKA